MRNRRAQCDDGRQGEGKKYRSPPGPYTTGCILGWLLCLDVRWLLMPQIVNRRVDGLKFDYRNYLVLHSWHIWNGREGSMHTVWRWWIEADTD